MEYLRKGVVNLQACSSITKLQLLLLFLSILIGVTLRLYGLDHLGPWSDELASLYFAENPALIFSEETHPPLFYLYLKPFIWLFGPDIFMQRIVVSLTGLSLMAWAICLARKIFTRNELILFSILILLCQGEIVHTRMIRPYAIFLNLTVILFLLANLPKADSFKKIVVGFILSGIHPLGFLVPIGLIINCFLSKKEFSKESLAFSLSVLPALIYYGIKSFAAANSLTKGYAGEAPKVNYFIYDVLLAFAGEHYPKINIAPIPMAAVILTTLFVLSILAKGSWDYFKNKKKCVLFNQTIVLILVAVTFTEIFSEFVRNIRVGRYFIFLLGPLILSFVSLYGNIRFTTAFVFTIQLTGLVIIKPLLLYPGEREAMEVGKAMIKSKSNLGIVFCANKFQYFYYYQKPHEHCIDQFKKFVEEGKDFVFVDLNGYGKSFLPLITERYILNNIHSIGPSLVGLAILKN